jgi:hypothetical protein
MKKRFNILFILACALIVTAFTGCKKPKKVEVAADPVVNTDQANGMPANLKSVNGYFYASYKSTSFSGYSYAFFAGFSDPGRKLSSGWDHYNDNTSGFGATGSFGNIDVGIVTLNNSFPLQKNSFNPNIFYSYNTNYFQPLTSAQWTTEGNLSFSPMDIQVSRGFPTAALNATFASISKAAGYTINLSQYVSNFDSAVVTITDNFSWQSNLRKGAGAGAQSITFTPAELSPLYVGSSGYIYVYAYNYSNQVINNKVYLYELSAKIQRNIVITQ